MTSAEAPIKGKFPTWGLVSFILSLAAPLIPGPGFVYSAIAAIIGHVSFVKEKRLRGFALTGIILGWLGVIFGLVIFFVVIPLAWNLIESVEWDNLFQGFN